MMLALLPEAAAARINGKAYFEVRNVPVTLTANDRFHSSSVVSSMVFSISIPAALTRMSRRPAACRTCSMAAMASGSDETSSLMNLLLLSSAPIDPAGLRSAAKTVAPSRVNRSQIARPMPPRPPVTTATFPASLMPRARMRQAPAHESDAPHAPTCPIRLGH